MTDNICVICGEEFAVKTKRRGRPRIYCSKKCRIVAHNERMVIFQRNKRTKQYKIIQQIHVQAHNLSIHEGLNVDPHEYYSPRIDLNHDTWDFIPGISNNIGTLTERDLDIIETKDGYRIKAMVNLKKRGLRK